MSEGARRDPRVPGLHFHTALGCQGAVIAVSRLCPVSRRAGTKSHPFRVSCDSTSCSEQAVFLCFKCQVYLWTPIHPAEPRLKAPPVLKLPRCPFDPPTTTLCNGQHLLSTCHGPGAVLTPSVCFLLSSSRSHKWVWLLLPFYG